MNSGKNRFTQPHPGSDQNVFTASPLRCESERSWKKGRSCAAHRPVMRAMTERKRVMSEK
jgi:hypothetical protein